MSWADLPAPAVWAEYLCEASQAEAALMQPADQALPGICGCALHLTLPVRGELASAFGAPVSMLVCSSSLVLRAALPNNWSKPATSKQ